MQNGNILSPSQPDGESTSPTDDELFQPGFDLGEFRWTAARYVKRLIRARWKTAPGFLSEEELRRWRLENIADDTEEAGQLMQSAASDLRILNRDFIPRCGSGGIKRTDEGTAVGRLMESLAFLALPGGGIPDHNGDLLNAAEQLRRGETIDWDELVNWDELDQIRDDLDQLPEPQRANDEVSAHSLSDQPPYLGLIVNHEERTTNRGESESISFRRHNAEWQVFLFLFQRGRRRTSVLDLAREWEGFALSPDPELNTVRRTVSSLRELLQPLGVAVDNERELGYRLESSSENDD